ncbi:arsenite efflux transporter metallochaperone ArsD [Alicyclobacillus ferrooxydans]|uniref:Transcriptional regulator n=1 Tax=Alicyclobacillus ferrooxydans TaxID=471514 RepID=A0A0P9D2S5_9BACL|nr:arsenite efflux transporter metallochaperone ArsD [Alicyclobacillus ferrooxydans]KPV43815.1 transcriptional regulator [Alicyclobacillus ferrooxydans]
MNIEFFDPEMCCSTGVCGPSPDPELIRVNEMIDQLKAQGHTTVRYMMSRNPMAFSSNKQVYQELIGKGAGALPIVVVDGEVVAKGHYPRLDDFMVEER